MAEEGSGDEITNTEAGKPDERPRKIRDLFTDRVVGIVTGAAIPVVLLLIPIINKYLDNSKEIQTLQIKENSEDIEDMKRRMVILTNVIVSSQMQIQTLSSKLSECEERTKKEQKP